MKSVSTTPIRAFPMRAHALAAAICALALFTSGADAAQRKSKDADAAPAAAAKAKPHKAKKPARIRFERGSGETRAERDRRLQRECRGLPNAGACLGYGS